MQAEFARVLDLQTQYSASNTPQMQERGVLIRTTIPNQLSGYRAALEGALGEFGGELSFEGRDGTGRKTLVPWVRAYSGQFSASAQDGWYCVYLFRHDGTAVSLCLTHGSTTFDGSTFKPRSPAEAATLVAWARNVVGANATASGFVPGVDLGSVASLAQAYEQTTAYSKTYPVGSIPPDGQLVADMAAALGLLRPIYAQARLGRIPLE